MARSQTTITVKANEQYVRAMHSLAKARGEQIGAMVRRALDAMYGDELQQDAIPFVESVDRKIERSDERKIGKARRS